MPTVLISGSSSGIGLECAALLAREGYDVVATLRDPSRRQPLLDAAGDASGRLEVRELDVSDPGSIERCVGALQKEGTQVDVLINNAGFGRLGSVEQIDDAGLRRVMDTNFGGVWNLTRALLPSMRERGAGRIITVTSVGGILGQPFNDAYCAAKFAVEGMMESLAPVARQFGIYVSVVEPGPVHTEFVTSVRKSSQETLAAPAPGYQKLMAAYAASIGEVFQKYGQSGEDVARVIQQVIESETPHLRYTTSDYSAALVAQKLTDPSGDALAELFASRLQGG